jgi:hypothetical protein
MTCYYDILSYHDDEYLFTLRVLLRMSKDVSEKPFAFIYKPLIWIWEDQVSPKVQAFIYWIHGVMCRRMFSFEPCCFCIVYQLTDMPTGRHIGHSVLGRWQSASVTANFRKLWNPNINHLLHNSPPLDDFFFFGMNKIRTVTSDSLQIFLNGILVFHMYRTSHSPAFNALNVTKKCCRYVISSLIITVK